MDIVVLILLILGVIIGFKQGMINVIFGLIGIILAILLSLVFYKSFVKHVMPLTGIDQKIHTFVTEKLTMAEEEGKEFNVPAPFQNALGVSVIINQATSPIADKLTNFLLNAIGIVLMFVLFSIIITIIRLILNAIAKLPGLNLINRLAGGILGLVRTYVMILILFAIISIFSFMDQLTVITDAIENSKYAKQMYDTNPVVKILSTKEKETDNKV